MRAGSVKQIGSQAANAAADRLDGALTVADRYVDRYLPEDPADKVDGMGNYCMITRLNSKLHEIRWNSAQRGNATLRNPLD